MKRFLSLTLVVIMLLTTLMLTSCDPIAEAKGLINKVLGREEKEVRYTVTADEWAKVASINDFTATMSESYDGATVNITMAVTPDAAKVVMEYHTAGGNMDVEMYWDIKEGYAIQPDGNGNWVGYETSEDILEEMGINAFVSEINFSDLVYEEATKSYLYEDKEEDTLYNFYFENGNLVRLTATSLDPEYPATATIDNFGKTTVTLPEYTVEDVDFDFE